MQLPKPLNKYIEHTLLRPDATHTDFENFLDEALKYQFAAVCISPYMVKYISPVLKNEDIKVSTVVGFPHGTTSLETKLKDIVLLSQQGVDEIDFVLNAGDIKSGLHDEMGKELENLAYICSESNVVSKCVVETCYLDEDEKSFIFQVVNDYTQIDYLQDATGFAQRGSHLMTIMDWNARRGEIAKKEASNLIQLTPVGGRQTPLKFKVVFPHSLDSALQFIAGGADRLGMNSSVEVMEHWNAQSSTFTEGEETP